MKLIDFILVGCIVGVFAVIHAAFVVYWLKKNLPAIVKANAPPPQTLERGLLSRLEQATDGTRFYGKRY